MKRKLLFIGVMCMTLFSCKKESTSDKTCWQILDFSGNELNIICDKTEDELLNCTTCGNINGSGTNPLKNYIECKYFRTDAQKYYWERKCPGDANYSGNYLADEKRANCWLATNGCVIRKK
jgi:hypothetical protein